MNKKRIQFWLGLAVVLAVAAVAARFWFNRPTDVETARIKRGTAVQAVYATGVVEPTVNVPIAPRVAGKLVELKVDEGAAVRKGQVLARLEDANLQRGIEQLEAQELYARQALDRQERIVASGVGVTADRDRALSEWRAAKAATDKAREEKTFMLLRAPVNGVVMRRDGEVGQYIPINQVVFHVAAEGSLRISADVDEEDIPWVKVGQQVLVRADAFPEQVHEGSVLEITPRGDTGTRSYRVRISIAKDSPLRVGMTADTNIIIERHENAWLLTASAVDDSKVWVMRAGRAVHLPIRIGIAGEREIEVLEGLTPEDEVVAIPPLDIKEGQRLRDQQRPAAGNAGS